MTFIEALKANETEEVRLAGFDTYKIGELKHSRKPVGEMMQGFFQLVPKPQVVEFECEWVYSNGIYYPNSPKHEFLGKLRSLNNHRQWRVRCEEII